jgi:hypothetical protein
VELNLYSPSVPLWHGEEKRHLYLSHRIIMDTGLCPQVNAEHGTHDLKKTVSLIQRRKPMNKCTQNFPKDKYWHTGLDDFPY